MLNVYLCGSITEYYIKNEMDKAKKWRQKATTFIMTNIDNSFTFDPTVNFEKNITYKSRGVVTQNLKYLKESNLLLLNLEYLEKSPGTIFELTYAYLNHIPVIGFGKMDDCIKLQPHLNESIDMRFDTLNETLEYIKNMYGQE